MNSNTRAINTVKVIVTIKTAIMKMMIIILDIIDYIQNHLIIY